MTTTQDDPIKTVDEILNRFAEWTINNVNHGIYIPLPSPETKASLCDYFLELVGEDEKSPYPGEAHLSNGRPHYRNELKAELRDKIRSLM